MVLRQLTKEQAKEEVKKLVKEFFAYTKEEQESKSENQIKSEFISQHLPKKRRLLRKA